MYQYNEIVTRKTKNTHIRNMNLNELNHVILQWAAQEGWNPGKDDAKPFYTLDPKGYWLLEIDNNPIASLACVRYSKDYAFIGLYIVKPEYRHNGFGKQLWNKVLSLNTIASIGLNSVIEQVGSYKKSGFVVAARNTRYSGKTSTEQKNKHNFDFDPTHYNFSITSKYSLKDLIAYDEKVFGFDRSLFLPTWITGKDTYILVASKDNDIIGYGVLKPAIEGYKVAPLFANDAVIAEALYVELCQLLPDQTAIHIDVCDSNPNAQKVMHKLGLKKSFETIRMYKGSPPKMLSNKIFALTSLEIG